MFQLPGFFGYLGLQNWLSLCIPGRLSDCKMCLFSRTCKVGFQTCGVTAVTGGFLQGALVCLQKCSQHLSQIPVLMLGVTLVDPSASQLSITVTECPRISLEEGKFTLAQDFGGFSPESLGPGDLGLWRGSISWWELWPRKPVHLMVA